MAFTRPNAPQRPTAPTKPNPVSSSQKKVIPAPARGGGGNQGGGNLGGGGNGGNNQEPSPWLDHPAHTLTKPDPSASFVEYLRWMRSPHPKDSPQARNEDPNTKVQILQLAENGANYTVRLNQLTKRTKLIAGDGNYFEVSCPWRIRVGGHRGPESILLPAFDALGMPYIPSSTLRGVARAEALRQLKDEKEVAEYFGSLEANESNRMGKVIFLDAYPLANGADKSGGLAVDMANNNWTWDNNSLKYSPNPNPFLSLQNPTFLIGIRSTVKGNDLKLQQIRAWLTAGLESGTGSQINSGYGELVGDNATNSDLFFQVNFAVRGQLIHGRQEFTQWKQNQNTNQWTTKGKAEAEVRPIAFKSMLRYWFRSFAMGVLATDRIILLEASLFGSINPQSRGYVSVRIHNGEVVKPEARANYEGKKDPYGEEEGLLILSYSSEIPENYKTFTTKLFENLTWMMFHLGGIGQGARRPLYSRENRDRAPWWRGSNLVAILTEDSTEAEEKFWELPDSCEEFKQLFHRRLIDFYTSLQELSGITINYQSPKEFANPTGSVWSEAVDSKCTILIIKSNHIKDDKPVSLSLLHSTFHSLIDQSEKLKEESKKLKESNQEESKRLFAEACLKFTEAKNLCGHTNNDRIRINGSFQERKAIPSPVWISNPDSKYQVVTVFGSTQDPRKPFVKRLIDQGAVQIFPLA